MKTRDLIDITGWVRLVCFGMAFITRIFATGSAEIIRLFLPAVVTGVLSIYLQDRRSRFLPLLFCAAYIIPDHTAASLTAMTACVSVCAPFTWKKAWTVSRAGAEKMLYRGLGAYVLFAAAMMVTAADGAWTASVAFLTVFLSFTIFDLRVLRSERITDANYVWMNFAGCLLITFILLAVCTPAFRAVLKAVCLLAARYMIVPVLWLIIVIVSLVMNLILNLIAPVFLLFGKTDFHTNYELQIFDFSKLTGKEEELGESVMRIPDLVRFIALAVVLALLAYFAVRRIRRVSQSYGTAGTIERKQITDRPLTHRKNSAPLNAVRMLYVKYLRHMKKEGMTTDPCETSEMQAEHADHILQNTWGRQMRDYWLPARYGNAEKADLAGARDLYRKIRRRKRED